MVGPHIGALVGAWVYLLCVGIHLEEDEDFYDGGDVYKLNGNTATPQDMGKHGGIL